MKTILTLMMLYLACALGLTSCIPEISGKTCETVTSPSTGSVDFKSAVSNQSQVQKYSDLGKIRICKYSKRTKIKNINIPLIKLSSNQVSDQIFTTRDLLPEGNTSDGYLEFLKSVLLALFALVMIVRPVTPSLCYRNLRYFDLIVPSFRQSGQRLIIFKQAFLN